MEAVDSLFIILYYNDWQNEKTHTIGGGGTWAWALCTKYKAELLVVSCLIQLGVGPQCSTEPYHNNSLWSSSQLLSLLKSPQSTGGSFILFCLCNMRSLQSLKACRDTVKPQRADIFSDMKTKPCLFSHLLLDFSIKSRWLHLTPCSTQPLTLT